VSLVRTLWHDLCPWPIAEDTIWHAIAEYLHEPTTQRSLAELERERCYPEEMRRRLHMLGLSRFFAETAQASRDQVTDIPTDPGASHLTLPHVCGLNALIASVNTSLAVTVSVNTLALLPAYIGASPSQLAWVFTQVEAGAFGALLLTELDHGSDLFSIETNAESGTTDPAGQFFPISALPHATPVDRMPAYRLSGRKDLINGAGRHELLMVFARTKPLPVGQVSPLAAHGSFSLFLLARQPGVTSPYRWHTVPAPGADIASLQFDDVVIPAACRIGREGDGFTLVQGTLAVTRGGVGALASGLASRAVRMAARYVASRQIYGRPLVHLGAIADHLLHMRALELLATAMSVKATALLNRYGVGAAYHAAVAKVASCGLTEELVTEGRVLHGSRAFLVDEPYHRLVGDAPLYGTFDGTVHVVLDQLQRRLAQLAVPVEPTSRRLPEVSAAYREPPRRLLATVRERTVPLLINPATYLHELDDLLGRGICAPLLALADALLALVRHCRATAIWDDDQGLRLDAARLLTDLEALIAVLELTDPSLRSALGMASPSRDPLRLGPLADFTYGWFGGRLAAALRSLLLRVGMISVGHLDEAEAMLAQIYTRGRAIFRDDPALLLEES
jgi:alkylation response protein AidB-like acyl-CoA dehydrogenase